MLGAPSPTCPLRLCGVPGYDGRSNDVLYCRPIVQNEKQSVVVYFGGDVQDFNENMQSHRDNKNYLKWNLENTAQILQTGFLDCHIVIIRPSRMEYKTFSCFENFVPSANCGVPEHTPMHYALQHLEQLLQNISKKLRTMTDGEISEAMELSKLAVLQNDKISESPIQVNSESNDNTALECKQVETVIKVNNDIWRRENIDFDKCSLKLVGFSKGCVVLNQFLYEFHYLKTLTPDDNTMMKIVSKITDMYWLDGGHSGGKNTWITSRPLLETFTRLGIKVHIHVTPYQIQDDCRPWIKKEEKAFHDILCRLEASVERVVHFANVFPNLFLHFDVLAVFTQQNSSNAGT